MGKKEEAMAKYHEKIAESLSLVNSYFEPLGIEVRYEGGRLVPYSNDTKLMGRANDSFSREADCFILPDVACTEEVSLFCDFNHLLKMKRNIWADKFYLRLMPDATFSVNGEKVKVDGPNPLASLEMHGMISTSKFEVRLSQKHMDKCYESMCSDVSKIEVDENTIMTILYANRRAIIVEKDKVRVGENVDRWWDSEKGSFTEIPYSGYDDLYLALEIAVDSLLYNEWTNPDKIDIENGGDKSLYLRVIKRFLLEEIKRAIEYLKEKDNMKDSGEKAPQFVKKENEVNY